MIIHCQAVIFDLDGVLIDSTELIEQQWREFANHTGLDPEYVIDVAHGRRTEDVLKTLFPETDSADLAMTLEEKEGIQTDGLKIFPGVKSLLELLPSERWAVATSGARATAMTRLNFGDLPIPTTLITAERVKKGKPDPEVFLKAAEGLGANPTDCMVIEDAPAGIQAALNAGMKAVGVETSHSRKDLANATAIIPNAGYLELLPTEKNKPLQFLLNS